MAWDVWRVLAERDVESLVWNTVRHPGRRQIESDKGGGHEKELMTKEELWWWECRSESGEHSPFPFSQLSQVPAALLWG